MSVITQHINTPKPPSIEPLLLGTALAVVVGGVAGGVGTGGGKSVCTCTPVM
jgi:hypothetical protein